MLSFSAVIAVVQSNANEVETINLAIFILAQVYDLIDLLWFVLCH
jgi:hypothetical protein